MTLKTLNKLTEHQYIIRPDLKVVNCFEGNNDDQIEFGVFLLSIETTEAAGESLREMLQMAVDCAKEMLG